MVCTAPTVFFGALVTIDKADSPMLLSRALNATKLGVSYPPSSDRMISPVKERERNKEACLKNRKSHRGQERRQVACEERERTKSGVFVVENAVVVSLSAEIFCL